MKRYLICVISFIMTVLVLSLLLYSVLLCITEVFLESIKNIQIILDF